MRQDGRTVPKVFVFSANRQLDSAAVRLESQALFALQLLRWLLWSRHLLTLVCWVCRLASVARVRTVFLQLTLLQRLVLLDLVQTLVDEPVVLADLDRVQVRLLDVHSSDLVAHGGHLDVLFLGSEVAAYDALGLFVLALNGLFVDIVGRQVLSADLQGHARTDFGQSSLVAGPGALVDHVRDDV